MADVADSDPVTDPAIAMSQGIRHLLVRDYEMAVSGLAKVCEMLAAKHGDKSDELGEAYLLYGRALLGLAREEAGVLGGGVPGTEDGVAEEDEDEDDEEDEQPKDKEEDEQPKDKEDEARNEDEKAESSPKASDESESASKEAKTDGENSAKAEEAPSKETSQEAVKDAATAGSSGGQNGEASVENGDDSADDEEDVNNLQIAWEVLELAKLVLVKRGPRGWKHLAEAHRLLGEVAMESDNYQGALIDLEACLNLLQKIEPREPRAIAEIHYQLGLAYSLGNDYDRSIEEFNQASVLLEARIKELETSGESTKSDDPFYTVSGEIDELKELLPEIQEKIADMRGFKEEERVLMENLKQKVADGTQRRLEAGPSNDDGASSSGVAKAPKPASDISHLVRKKRKPEDSEKEESASPCKKPTPEKIL